MKKIVLNEMEKIAVADLNDVQEAIHQNLYDSVLYNMLGERNGFLGDSFKPSFVDATHVKIKAGVGFVMDATKIGHQAKFAMVKQAADFTQVIPAADPANPRWDIICVKNNATVTGQEQRYVKNSETKKISLQVVDKVLETNRVLQVVSGVAGVNPAIPAVPAGYELIAKLYVTAVVGITSASSVYDARAALYIATPSLKMDLPNNQVAALDVPGLFLDKSIVDSAVIPFSVYRKTGSLNVKFAGELFASYRPDDDQWDVDPAGFGGDHGVTFSATPAGQVQVVTSNIAGSNYVGSLRYSSPSVLNQ